MPSQGTQNKRFVSSISLMDAREIYPKIIDQARDREFASLTKIMGRYKKTTMSIFHNHVNEDTNVIGVVDSVTTGNNVAGLATSVIVLTEATSGAWGKADVINIRGKNAIVRSVSTTANVDTLTIDSVNGTGIPVAATNKVYWRGKAAGEGAKPGTGIRYKTTPYSNKIQIVEVYGVPITDINSMSKVEIEGEGIYGYQRSQEMIMVKKAISAMMIGGQGSTTQFSDASPALVDADGNPIQTASGMVEQIATYGVSAPNITTSGAVVGADISAYEDLLLAVKAPKDFMLVGGTAAMRPYSTFLKNLASSGVTSVRMHIDGREVDLVVDKFTSPGQFRYDLVQVDTFDDGTLYDSGVGGISAALYGIPKDEVALVGGGSEKRFNVRYQEQAYGPKAGGPNVKWADMVREHNSGGLAPNPTGDDNVWKTKWTAYMGPEFLGVRHFFRQAIFR